MAIVPSVWPLCAPSRCRRAARPSPYAGRSPSTLQLRGSRTHPLDSRGLSRGVRVRLFHPPRALNVRTRRPLLVVPHRKDGTLPTRRSRFPQSASAAQRYEFVVRPSVGATPHSVRLLWAWLRQKLTIDRYPPTAHRTVLGSVRRELPIDQREKGKFEIHLSDSSPECSDPNHRSAQRFNQLDEPFDGLTGGHNVFDNQYLGITDKILPELSRKSDLTGAGPIPLLVGIDEARSQRMGARHTVAKQ